MKRLRAATAWSPRRLDIQGLRAVAVLAVVAFHAGLPVPGGFVGVDVFFVISGYVITSMLERQWSAAGRISLPDFYLRRFKRLAPALALAVCVTVLLSFVVLPGLSARVNTGWTAVGTMLLGSNVAIAATTGGYFDPPAQTNPLLNMWSLSVEEQFYLLFPVLLIGGWLVARRWRRRQSAAATVIAALAAVSFALAVVGSTGTGGEWLGFYSPVTRAWEFAAGALLVLAAGPMRRLVRGASAQVLGVVGILAVLTSLWLVSDGSGAPALALPVLGAAALLVAGAASAEGGDRPTVVGFALSVRPITAIGDWSYSIYLWHWPLIVLAAVVWSRSTPVLVAAALVSFVPAVASFHLLETPLRRRRLRSGRGVAALVLVSIVPALALGLALVNSARADREELATQTAKSIVIEDIGQDRFYDYMAELNHPCTPESIRAGTEKWNDVVRCLQSKAGSSPTVALLGDSHMEHLFLGLSEALPDENVVYYTRPTYPTGPRYEQIVEHVIATDSIDTVILGARWDFDDYPALVDSDELASTLERLRGAGKEVFVIDDIPGYPFWSDACRHVRIPDDPVCSRPAADFWDAYDGAMEPVRNAVRSVPGVHLIANAPHFCNGDVCSMLLDGYLMYRDSDHLGITGSRYLARRMLADNPLLVPDAERLPRDVWFDG